MRQPDVLRVLADGEWRTRREIEEGQPSEAEVALNGLVARGRVLRRMVEITQESPRHWLYRLADDGRR